MERVTTAADRTVVGVGENTREGVERALKQLKRRLDNAGIIGELKRRQYYAKRSVRRRLKHHKAVEAQQRREVVRARRDHDHD
jgi:ribosomal protein S21